MKQKPLIVSGGLLTGVNVRLLDLHNAYVKGGHISKNDKIDFYIHTWDIPFNHKYIQSLKRYEDKFNFILRIEDYESRFLPLIGELIHPNFIERGHYKTFLLLYSLWNAFDLIPTVEDYDSILKYKVDIDSDQIPWGILENEEPKEFFKHRSVWSFPTLHQFSYNDCFYAQHTYRGFDERHFMTYVKPIKKIFLDKTVEELMAEVKEICLYLFRKYELSIERRVPWGVQGPIIWGELLKRHNIPYINVDNKYVGNSMGEITPKFEVKYENNSYIIKDKDNYNYRLWNKKLT